MKKRLYGVIITALLFAVSCGFAMSGCNKKPKLPALETEQSEYNVEYGDAFILPAVTHGGETVAVIYDLKDETGGDVATSYGMFTPVVGTYTVTASADGYESVVFKVVCRDTTPPDIALSEELRPVLTGFSATLPTFVATDRSGIKDGSVKAELIAPSGQSNEYSGGETVDINEVGTYNYRVTASDIYDNVAVSDNEFTAQNGSADDIVLTKGQMFNFDTLSAKNLVLVDVMDEGSRFDIVDVNDIKDSYTGLAYSASDGVTPSGKALAVSADAGKTAAFSLSMTADMIKDHAPVWESTWSLKIRFATDGRFTSMKVYNVKTSGRSIVREITPYDRDYQEQMTWYEAELRAPFFDLSDPEDMIYKLGFEIFNYSSREITVYFDEIFFEEKPDYTPKNGDILNFSDGEKTLGFARDLAGYGSRGAKITYETENIPAGAGAGVTGVLKVSTTLSMQGTEIIFPKIYSRDYFDAVTIRLYLSHVPTHLRLGFFDDKGNHQNRYMAPIGYGENAHLNCVQGWKDYVFRGDQYNYLLTGNIVGVYMGIFEHRDKYFLERYPEFDLENGTIDMYIASITYTRTDKEELDAITNGFMQDNPTLGGKNVALFNSQAYEKFLSGSYTAKFESDYAGSANGAFVITHGGAWSPGYTTFTPPAQAPVSDIYGFKVRYKALGTDPRKAAIYMLTTHRNNINDQSKRYYWNLSSSAEVIDATDGWQTVLIKFNPDNVLGEAITSITLSATDANHLTIAWDYIVAIPYINDGTIEVNYGGSAFDTNYFSDETFNWSLLSFTCAGYPNMQFEWTVKKDGNVIDKPSGKAALEAGNYEIEATGIDNNVSASGKVSFTVSDPETVNDIVLNYDGSASPENFVVNDLLETSKLAASSATLDGKGSARYTYELVLPSGSTVNIDGDYSLASSGKYTLRVTGRVRGFTGSAEIEFNVAAATAVTVSVAYDGSATANLMLEDDLRLNSSKLSVSASVAGGQTEIADSEIRRTITFGNETVVFDIDTYRFTKYGRYTVDFEVTKKGYEGSATLVVTVSERLEITIKRGGNDAFDIRTVANKSYDLTQFSVDGNRGADVVWSISFGGGAATALDMTNSEYAFSQNGVYTVKAALDHEFLVGEKSFTVTVENLPFGAQTDGSTLLADFANEGYNAEKDYSTTTLSYVADGGKTVLKSFSTTAWNGLDTTFVYELPESVSIKDKIFHIRLKVAGGEARLRFNRKKTETGEAFDGLTIATASDSVWVDKAFSYADIYALVKNYIPDFDGSVNKLYFQHCAANMSLYIEKIWLTDDDGLTDFPQGGVELIRLKSYTKTASGWGDQNLYSESVTSTEINKNGSIRIRLKRTAVGNATDMRVYLGFNNANIASGTNGMFLTGTTATADSDYVILTFALNGGSDSTEQAKSNFYFSSSDTITVTQIKFRLYFNAGTSFTTDIDWVAYIPPEA